MILHSAAIVILSVLIALQIRKTKDSFAPIARKFFLLSVIVVVSILAYYSVRQYYVWVNEPLTRNFFNNGMGYYTRYVAYVFWAQYIVSFFAALLMMKAMRWYDRRHGNKFFYSGEEYLAGAAILLNGHPSWIFYILAAIICYAIATVFLTKIRPPRDLSAGGELRVSFYYGWLPVGLIALFLKPLLGKTAIFIMLVFARSQLII